MPVHREPSGQLVQRVVSQGLGGVYLIAFSSLRAQVLGLYGQRGIRPIAQSLDVLAAVPSRRERWRLAPTLFWLDASDAALVRLCVVGQAASALLMLGIAPRALCGLLWAAYLSFVSVGREFMGYQWDALLLESGFQAALAAPRGLWPGRRAEPPPWFAIPLLRLLVFRLHFESGLVKLLSGDTTWRNGTAIAHHLETQPLPNPIAPWAHDLPRSWHRVATRAVLGLELGAPWLAFGPRRFRRAGFAALLGLQGLIAATGSFGFFNLLTVVLSLSLLDDAALARGRRMRTEPQPRSTSRSGRVGRALLGAPLAVLAALALVRRCRPRMRIPAALMRLQRAVAPLHLVNSYGLFAVMTTLRPEIIVEGSYDAVHWRRYDFRYKPGDLQRPPRTAAPHQPRLDWQMWFAALGPRPAWFVRFATRLLEGSSDVLALLESNPFPERPPTYIRALLYDYHMTDRATRRRTGQYWRRQPIGVYLEPCALH